MSTVYKYKRGIQQTWSYLYMTSRKIEIVSSTPLTRYPMHKVMCLKMVQRTLHVIYVVICIMPWRCTMNVVLRTPNPRSSGNCLGHWRRVCRRKYWGVFMWDDCLSGRVCSSNPAKFIRVYLTVYDHSIRKLMSPYLLDRPRVTGKCKPYILTLCVVVSTAVRRRICKTLG